MMWDWFLKKVSFVPGWIQKNIKKELDASFEKKVQIQIDKNMRIFIAMNNLHLYRFEVIEHFFFYLNTRTTLDIENIIKSLEYINKEIKTPNYLIVKKSPISEMETNDEYESFDEYFSEIADKDQFRQWEAFKKVWKKRTKENKDDK